MREEAYCCGLCGKPIYPPKLRWCSRRCGTLDRNRRYQRGRSRAAEYREKRRLRAREWGRQIHADDPEIRRRAARSLRSRGGGVVAYRKHGPRPTEWHSLIGRLGWARKRGDLLAVGAIERELQDWRLREI